MSISGLTFAANVSNLCVISQKMKIISVDITVPGLTELKDDRDLDSTGLTMNKQNCPDCSACLFSGAGWNRSAFFQMSAASEVGLFSHKLQYSSRFVDNFRTITKTFDALTELDSESFCICWLRSCNYQIRNAKKHNRKTYCLAKEFNERGNNFNWSNLCIQKFEASQDRISTKTAVRTIAKGGLGLPDIRHYINALKLIWMIK